MVNDRERSPWSDAVAATIAAERAASRRTQDEVVRLSGISRSTYIRLEKGLRVADVTQLSRLCLVFGISLPEFFRRVEQRLPD